LELLQERGKRRLPLKRIYRQLFNKDLYLKAYGKIYRNAGAMTPGVTGETADAMALEKIETIIAALRCERYQWQPARRTYIPTKNGKQRPLGMPVWSDKLLGEVLRLLLSAYYDPQFSPHSHGFRPGRGCHTALRDIYRAWKGVAWLIEGDISDCFNRLDHDLLVSTLSEHIQDGRFLRLIRRLLDAGYLEKWQFNRTLSGVPQGSMVSPILSNILLDKLDQFVEQILIPQYTTGNKRRANKAYEHLMNQAHRCFRKGQKEAARQLRRQAQHLPSQDTHDPSYRRLWYCRYADDFILGFIGPKAEAEEIKHRLKEFLQEVLKLELSEDKTLLTHARSKAAKFLGYEITSLQEDHKRTKNQARGTKCRSINGHVGLRVPRAVLLDKCKRYKRRNKAIHRTELLNESDYTIVATYQLEFQGLVNYYRLAYNLHTLGQLRWVMEQSLTKTLAHKHKRSVKTIYAQYQATLEVAGTRYQGLQVVVPREGKPPLKATWGGVPLKWDDRADIEDQPLQWWNRRTELEKRLLAQVCEQCGATSLTDRIEVHHIRALKDLKHYTGREPPLWVKQMVARRRKTLVVCRTCHMDIQYGRPKRRQALRS
jgi:group II intron reverse transcriptase/maturase